MGTIKRFEEMKAWNDARSLAISIYEVTSTGTFAKDFGLSGQIQRASVSIMSNIAEGFERGTTKEFLQFLNIAKGSVAEVRSQLHIAHDLQYIDRFTFEKLKKAAEEVSSQLAGFIRYLRNPDRMKQRRLKD